MEVGTNAGPPVSTSLATTRSSPRRHAEASLTMMNDPKSYTPLVDMRSRPYQFARRRYYLACAGRCARGDVVAEVGRAWSSPSAI
jgi:hypothetical protein